MTITIRSERSADIKSIARLTEAAFQKEAYSNHTEHVIVDALRRCGQLSISLVALDGDAIVGHVAISPVTLSSGADGWFGLGPISVLPDRQRQGVGSKLLRAALAELRRIGGVGCVVLGDPAYYGRFGFKDHPGLELAGVPPAYFQAIALSGSVPSAVVRYHEAFDATE